MVFGAIAGAVLGGAASLIGQERANRATAASARDQMAFQERMYKNRYQMQMADMKKAGLNPMLSYSQSPGPAPTGARYEAQNVAQGIPAAVNSAFTNWKLGQEVKLTNANTGKAQADADRAQAEADLARAKIGETEQNTKLLGQKVATEAETRWLRRAQTDSSRQELKNLKEQNKLIQANTVLVEIRRQIEKENLTIAQKDALLASIDYDIFSGTIGEIRRELSAIGAPASVINTAIQGVISVVRPTGTRRPSR